MEKSNFKSVTSHIRTTEEKNEIIELIEELLENNFRRDQKPLPNTPFSKNATDAIFTQINELGASNNREKIEKYLEALLSEIKKLPEMRISVAISPTEKLKNNLKNWASENGLENLTFNIEVRSEIIAGAIIMSHEGEYGNYSLSHQLEDYFTQKRQEILALL